MQPIVEVNNLGKRYNITHQQGGYVALRDVLTYIVKKPFSFLKAKAKHAVGLATKEEFWAVKNVSFSVNKGEVIGIIGHNGAGKSTLLKILTGITPPTEGEVIMRGRVSSLLEVGTGFHPELTGRENIFLNGAILGMTRKEIARKFDEIVEFAGVAQFLDTPVKYYSSGMYVRLAFSVAAHMEPDILIVDEVLAVGDAEFQKKCLGKMEEVTRTEGRTILFVSHNMSAIQGLCKRTLFLKKGKVAMFDSTEKVVEQYLSSTLETAQPVTTYPKESGKKMQLRSVSIRNEKGELTAKIHTGESFSVDLEYDVNEEVAGAHVGLICLDHNNTSVFLSADTENNPELLRKRSPGTYKTTFACNSSTAFQLTHGLYTLRMNLEITGYAFDQKEVMFSIIPTTEDADFAKNKARAVVTLDGTWETRTL